MAYYYRNRSFKKKTKSSFPLNRKFRMSCPKHGELIGYTQSFNNVTVYESLNRDTKKVELKCYKCLEESVQEQRNELFQKELKVNGGVTSSELDSKAYIYNWASAITLFIAVFGSFIVWAYYSLSLALLNAGVFGTVALFLYLRCNYLEKKSLEISQSSTLKYIKSAKSIVEEEESIVSQWRIKQAKMRKERVNYTFEEIDKMNGFQFENFIKNLLKNTGYDNPQLTKASGDEGVDIIAYKNEKKIAIQCKRYSGKISNSAIQQVYSGKTFYDCHEAYVITNSQFTENAIILANKLKVNLIDRDDLFDLMQNVSEIHDKERSEYQTQLF